MGPDTPTGDAVIPTTSARGAAGPTASASRAVAPATPTGGAVGPAASAGGAKGAAASTGRAEDPATSTGGAIGPAVSTGPEGAAFRDPVGAAETGLASSGEKFGSATGAAGPARAAAALAGDAPYWSVTARGSTGGAVPSLSAGGMGDSAAPLPGRSAGSAAGPASSGARGGSPC